MIGYLNHVRRLVEREECHPDWGKKRIARMEKLVEQKEKKISKKVACRKNRKNSN